MADDGQPAADRQIGTKRHQSAPTGAKSPEIVPNGVRETFAGEVAIYNGRRWLGDVVPCGKDWVALAASGRQLGRFRKERDATGAVCAAARGE